MPYKSKRKQNKLLKTAKWAVIGGIVGDVTAFGVGYYCYRQMKNSSDFRYKVYNYDPRFVDMYYRANEKYGDGKARQLDYQKWDIQNIESFEFVRLLGL